MRTSRHKTQQLRFLGCQLALQHVSAVFSLEEIMKDKGLPNTGSRLVLNDG